jgi:VanZ family protein
MKRLPIKYLYSIVIAAVIFYLSTATGKALPQMPPVPYLDKVVHIIMYMVLAGALVIEIKKKNFFISIILPILYGGLLELLQEYFFPPRTGDWWDFLSDIIGVLLGFFIVRQYIIKHKYNGT